MLAVKGIYNNGQIKLTEPFAQTELKKTITSFDKRRNKNNAI
ncbi:hypothetical protein BGP_2012 [Beggiatoa sp. PS]|nr:hypothetical protein BGP_2012 [Beggiatoa sp. PS]